MVSCTLLCSVGLLLSLLSFAQANYHIDDGNSTITYSGDWEHFPGVDYSLDKKKTYNNT
jgi:hypothetical protein